MSKFVITYKVKSAKQVETLEKVIKEIERIATFDTLYAEAELGYLDVVKIRLSYPPKEFRIMNEENIKLRTFGKNDEKLFYIDFSIIVEKTDYIVSITYPSEYESL